MQKINMRKFSKISFIFVSIMLLLIVACSLYGLNDFYNMRKSSKQYILCENAAHRLQTGSDILTEQVRLYTVTGNAEYLQNYFKEVNVTKNRETAVEELKENFNETDIYHNLQDALGDSRQLMQNEYYAMRLTAEALGTNKDDLPDEIANVQISDDDMTLSSYEMRQKSCNMVFSDVYQKLKKSITNHVDECLKGLIEKTENRQQTAFSMLKYLYAVQAVLIIALAIYITADNIIMQKMIIEPIVRYNEKIKSDELISVAGVAELQSLAETYNKILKENHESQRRIKYEAEHDSLTDLLNKGAFNKILNKKIADKKEFALMVADIDEFKIINDVNGHDIGDGVIKYVAKKLQEIFNDNCFVFRIGGDEFAVIIDNASENSKQIIEDNFNKLKAAITFPTFISSQVTISAGVAFDNENTTSDCIFKNADKALYTSKNCGKNRIFFYDT